MPFRCLFHVHTRCSFDSLLSPAKILAKAREIRTDVLIVTDHNTIQGSLNTRALAPDGSPMVVIAAEYRSEKGDIVGMFLKEEIRSHDSAEIMQQIHAQGGLAVLPHPYKGHTLDDALLSGVDIIETHNARCSPDDNGRAVQLARAWNRLGIAGADAHCLAELSAAVNEFSADLPASETDLRDRLLHAPRQFFTKPSPALCRPYSQMVKAVKTRNPRLFLYQVKRMALTLTQKEKSF